MTYTLVLLRHGESEWNAKNLFTGWVDVALSEKGVEEAKRGGTLLTDAGVLPDVVHTSLLRRAITDREPRARRRRPALDPGQAPLAAQRAPLRRAAGQGQEADPRGVRRGRSSCSGAGPTTSRRRPSSRAREFSQDADPRYAGEPTPATECLKDVLERALPYWEDAVVPDLRAGRTVLVAAHGNSLRAIIKHLDGVSDEAIAGLNVPTGIPLLYELDEDLRPTTPGGRYLDPEAAAAAIAAVANQGR